MNRIVLAPDSFKGTMSAKEICDIWESCIRKHLPDAAVHSIPMADGGEGMVASYLNSIGGQKIQAVVSDPRRDSITAEYGILPDGTAVIEMASCAGLPLMKGRPDIRRATTLGVGQLLLDAKRRGCGRVILGLGGSATNDMGMGMAYAAGYRFYSGGTEVEPLAENMAMIDRIEAPKEELGLTITAACDVDNPLYGPKGAAFIFGPQKGATPEDVVFLDRGLQNMAQVMKRCLGTDVSGLKGAGAAGGMGAGLCGFFGAELKSGIQLLLDAAGFDHLLEDADLVLTGEGRIDGQSIHGKVPVGVAERAKKAGVPCVALCGSIGDGAELVYDYGICSVFSAVQTACDFSYIETHCREDMARLTDSVLRLLLLPAAKD